MIAAALLAVPAAHGDAPATTIVSGPPPLSASAAASFEFTASDPAATFECRLDEAGSWDPCTSPHAYAGVPDGAHTFAVRGHSDGDGGGTGPRAEHAWTVDTTPPPTPTVVGGPTGTVATAVASLTFLAEGTAECSVDDSAFAGCSSPHELSGLADGAHSVAVRAVDAAGNRSPATTHTWTVDTTAPPTPTITGGPDGTVASTSASLTFEAQETPQCTLDGAPFAPCSSPYELDALADGVHTFAVRAVDGVGNQSPASAPRSWVVDTTKPALSLPGGVTAEADAPSGSVVHFDVSATDGGAPLPPAAIQCSPGSGVRFPLGRTSVGCAATDTVGNRSEGAFTVLVRDTTPPTLNAPDVTLTAPRAAGIRRTDATLATYLSGVRATDLVSTPTVTNDAPELLPVGRRQVTFTARDGAGNTSTSTATVTVQPPGKPAPPVDVTPPADVRGLRVVAGDGAVTLTWLAPARDVAAVAVYRNRSGRTGAGTRVYRGLQRRFVDRRVANGVRYRYVVVAFDRAGNRSRGVVRLARPVALLLRAPRPNARVSTAPLLRWTPVRSASYYNVQVWRGGRKILSAWPVGAQVQLPRAWTFEGRRYRLTRGVYTWYVWPGIGAKALARYGPMLGRSSFVVVPPV